MNDQITGLFEKNFFEIAIFHKMTDGLDGLLSYVELITIE